MIRPQPLIWEVLYFMKEIFKDIPNYKGMYQVSNLGNVKSLERKVYSNNKLHYTQKEKILNKHISTRGYYSVTLSKNSKTKTRTIHQLVAITFLNYKPDKTTKIVVDHIDANKLNNNLNNLQLISNRENINKDKKRELPTGVTKENNKYRVKIFINKKSEHLGMFNTIDEASKAYKNKLLTLKNN